MPRRRTQPQQVVPIAPPPPPATIAIIQQIPRPETAPSPSMIVSLLRANRTAAEALQEIRSSLGGTVSDAVTNHGLHKKAWGWAKQLDGMSPAQMNDLLTHLFCYIQAGTQNRQSILQRALSAMRLPMGEAEPEPEPEPEAPAAAITGSVTPFPAQPDRIRQVAAE